ncbi:MAG TPA: nucleotide exchange factor GrpE [Pyrinomonadaceae bacterium]|jgi:molecular chaperone GrpE
MKSDRKGKPHRIPIKFMDVDPDTENEVFSSDPEDDASLDDLSAPGQAEAQPESGDSSGGPDTAELIATRSELKRVEAENAELKDRLARRQADFENYRKRVDRERSETYNRVVADVAAKLLPVSDNLKRALDTEASVEAAESDEFRHFLSGVDLIWKQLNGVLEALGVKPIAAVGEPFDPHLHEAVVTEATDEFEPDTVIQEILAGYRLGDKLIRPALVKVATRK